MNVEGQVYTILINAGATIAIIIVNFLLALLARWVNSKTKNENVKEAMDIISTLVSTVTMSMRQTVIEDLKKAAADGKLTEEEKQRVKEQAMKIIMAQIPPTVKQTAELAVKSVENFVSHAIEEQISWNKYSAQIQQSERS